MNHGLAMHVNDAAADNAALSPHLTHGARICARCVLPSTLPGIRFDEQGVCNYCREAAPHAQDTDKEHREHWRKEFLSAAREAIRSRPGAGHDVLMAYSGGKDSTYGVYLLSHVFGLRVLALTVDNGFMSRGAMDNMRRVLDRLGVDHLLARPSQPLMRALFRTSLERDMYPARALLRASSVCTSCISVVKALVLKTAMDMRIPFTAFGWTPGQAPKEHCIIRHNPLLLRGTMGRTRDTLVSAAGPAMAAYFPDLEHMNGELPSEVHPLAFVEYDEERMTEIIRRFGWQRPKDTDPNSSNCLLNALGNREHLRRHGFHPYALEIAGIVRAGGMTREEGLRKLQAEDVSDMAETVRAMLYADGGDCEPARADLHS